MDAYDVGLASGEPLITYNRCWDARSFALCAALHGHERHHVERILEALASLGCLTLPRVDAVPERAPDLNAVLVHLRRTLGAIVVNAAIDAAAHPASPVVQPQTLVPLWEFEAENLSSDVLTASGLLFGGNLEVRAVPVEDDDVVPPGVMQLLCGAAARQADAAGTVRIPGHPRPYAVLATVRAG